MNLAVENKSDCLLRKSLIKGRKKNAKCFPVGCLKLMLRFTEKGKFGWASCCETWLRFEIEVLRCKKNEERNIWVVGYPVSWAPCCE